MLTINTTILSYMALVATMCATILFAFNVATKKTALKKVAATSRRTLRRQNLR